jgi:hypothetical protein
MADPEPLDTPRRAFIVLGMHRSGTSALTRLLALHGLQLPARIMPPLPENERGFWEAPEVARLNDRLLALHGLAWNNPAPLNREALTGRPRRAAVEEITALLATLFPGQADFVLKDPRMCRLLGLWLPALRNFGAEPVAIFAVRHPLEVAASLATRNDMARPQALLLWLAHVLEAERATRGLPRQVVHYDDLLRNWVGATRGLRQGFGLGPPDKAAIADFLSPGLRHAQSYMEGLLRDPAVPAAVKRVYAELRRAPFESGLDPMPFDQARRDLAALQEPG